jgi:hypothetical protein
MIKHILRVSPSRYGHIGDHQYFYYYCYCYHYHYYNYAYHCQYHHYYHITSTTTWALQLNAIKNQRGSTDEFVLKQAQNFILVND